MAPPNLPGKMLAAQVVEYNKPYKIHEVPVPTDLGPQSLLVKVAVASLCHTDGMVVNGDFNTKLPSIASHEGAGTVVEVGTEVKNFAPGDRVMVGIPQNPCGHCGDCLGPENFKQYCTNIAGHLGVTMDGAFADYLLSDARTSVKLPDAVSFQTAAPMACAGCTVWRGVLQAKLKSGETLAIIGSGGGLGHLGIQFARALGLQVIAIDARDEGLELSKKVGAQIVIDARKGNKSVVEEVHKVTNNQGADATINVSDANSAAATACAVTKMHCKMIQIAQPENVSVPFHELIFRDIRIEGSLVCSPDEARRMLDVVAEHKISVKTNPFNGIKKLPELVELAHSGKMSGKGVVIVDEKQIAAQQKPGLELV
ncbi:hypothetical protein BLS_002007 [Venturia inaequalis]|uniref:Enoyl reductase (ER) domain-containing protein n=1 Tax=Venturia inaequalis TaxID=5025 RepID=A0A8H3U1L4_VENIN|nr:hypothetical protein BLS_002007 [Venturia inaequalis]RDI87319.1 hypothetical protein Vi05172_g2858 [Venturia inaequalis]